MSDTAWIDTALSSARPQAVGALLRYFTSAEAAHIRMHLDRLKRDSTPRGAKA